MPWKETRVVEQRLRFVASICEAEEQGIRVNFARLCEQFGISRAKGYKWVARFRADGPAGLVDRKSVAHSCPQRTSDAVIDRVLALRKEHPFDGPKKLRTMLGHEMPRELVPAASTIGDILKRHGLINPRLARLRVPPSSDPLAHASAPNRVWTVDFKGHFALGDGSRCHPLTINDGASRFSLKLEGLVQPRHELVLPHFERAFREYGRPDRIRSDNGAPFATKALGGLSQLQVWWIQLGIVPERIEPGHPEQNGRHERFHLTLKQQTASPPAATLIEQQRAFDRFRADYNNRRPHEALGQKTPAACYEPSRRLMPERLLEPEYGADCEVRRVNKHGYFSVRGQALYAGALLARQPIALKPLDEDEWELFYGPVLLGYVIARGKAARIERVA